MSAFSAGFFLLCAIVSEVAGTTCMKLSDGFSRWLPTTLMFVFYLFSLSALTLAVRRIEIGAAYAIWSGLGMILITFIGIAFFRETISLMKIGSMLLIVAGVIGLQLSNAH